VPDVAVEHVLVVIVPYLHHAVAYAVVAAEALHVVARRIEAFLEHGVEVVRAEQVLAHGREDLDVRHGSNPNRFGMRSSPGRACTGSPGRFLLLDEVEVRRLIRRGNDQGFPVVHPVGILHDPAALFLAEDGFKLG